MPKQTNKQAYQIGKKKKKVKQQQQQQKTNKQTNNKQKQTFNNNWIGENPDLVSVPPQQWLANQITELLMSSYYSSVRYSP